MAGVNRLRVAKKDSVLDGDFHIAHKVRAAILVDLFRKVVDEQDGLIMQTAEGANRDGKEPHLQTLREIIILSVLLLSGGAKRFSVVRIYVVDHGEVNDDLAPKGDDVEIRAKERIETAVFPNGVKAVHKQDVFDAKDAAVQRSIRYADPISNRSDPIYRSDPIRSDLWNGKR